MADLSEYKKLLKTLLKPERYAHSLGASETAKKLAEKYGTDADKAELAGLLHDITKNMSNAEQLKMLEKYGVPLFFSKRTDLMSKPLVRAILLCA